MVGGIDVAAPFRAEVTVARGVPASCGTWSPPSRPRGAPTAPAPRRAPACAGPRATAPASGAMHLRIGRIVEEAERVLHAPREARLERRPAATSTATTASRRCNRAIQRMVWRPSSRVRCAGRRLALDAPTSMRPPQAPHAQRRSVGDLRSGGRAGVFQKPAIGAQRGRAAEKRPFRRGEYLSAAAAPREVRTRARHRPRQHGAHLRGPARRQEAFAGSPPRAARASAAARGRAPNGGAGRREAASGRRPFPRAARAASLGAPPPRGRRRRGRRRSPRNQPDNGRAPPRRRTGRRRGPPRGHRPRRAAPRGEACAGASPRASATGCPVAAPVAKPAMASRHHCSLISPIVGSRTTCGMRQLAGERGDHDEVGASRGGPAARRGTGRSRGGPPRAPPRVMRPRIGGPASLTVSRGGRRRP